MRAILCRCVLIWRNMALGPTILLGTIETPATPTPVPSASAINGIVRRKRTYVPSNSVPRVFVVDDEHVIASTLAAILKLHGYSARAFTSPLEALAAARSGAPDLLIADAVMPGLSGVDLANQMLAQYPECKVLLFSGQATTRDLLRDTRKQGNTFPLLQKPVQPSVMFLSIEALAGEKRS
jgi:DNA-binding NtrC family response regulator